MDPKILMEALDALIAGDTAKCAEILKALVASAAGGAAEPDGGEVPPARADAPPGDAPPGDGPPKPDARGYGRDDEQPMARGRRLDAEVARARKAADGTAALFARGRVRELRADGFELDAALEKELVGERDPDVLERRIADLTRGRVLGSKGQQRARGDVQHEGSPPPAGDSAAPMTAAQLAAEGFDQPWIADYMREHKQDPKAAAATLSGGREGRARKAREAEQARARAGRMGS